LNEPVETLKQPVAGVGAASDDLPVPALLHGCQIQDLKKHTNQITTGSQRSHVYGCSMNTGYYELY